MIQTLTFAILAATATLSSAAHVDIAGHECTITTIPKDLPGPEEEVLMGGLYYSIKLVTCGGTANTPTATLCLDGAIESVDYGAEIEYFGGSINRDESLCPSEASMGAAVLQDDPDYGMMGQALEFENMHEFAEDADDEDEDVVIEEMKEEAIQEVVFEGIKAEFADKIGEAKMKANGDEASMMEWLHAHIGAMCNKVVGTDSPICDRFSDSSA